jgi:hypothetical protein
MIFFIHSWHRVMPHARLIVLVPVAMYSSEGCIRAVKFLSSTPYVWCLHQSGYGDRTADQALCVLYQSLCEDSDSRSAVSSVKVLTVSRHADGIGEGFHAVPHFRNSFACPPDLEAAAGSGDCALQVGDASVGNLTDDTAGRRIDDVDGFPAYAGSPFPVDKQ